MADLTPREIVRELDKFIVGQENAKKAAAVAIRNRLRRQRVKGDLQDDIVPKNILMIGPTGVGKTEICRRLAKLVNAPFTKVEASKFTEVGYIGRDVDSIIRDLVESAVRTVRQEKHEEVKSRAQALAEDRLIELLAPLPQRRQTTRNPLEMLFNPVPREETSDDDRFAEKEREARANQRLIRERLANGELENDDIEIEVEDASVSTLEFFDGSSMQEMGLNIQDMLGGVLPKKKKRRRVKVWEARKVLCQEESTKLVDQDSIISEAVNRAEKVGIVFLDELDKVAGRERGMGPDVSREGVQRDLLPVVEGTTVVTKYGPVKTDHILFIGAGAFHVTKPADLIPELQGRFPIRVELEPLTQEDFTRILTEPKNSLTKQYQELLATDGVKLEFLDEGILELAKMAYTVNQQAENIGARRLHTVMEKLLEDVLFEAPDIDTKTIVIDAEYVQNRMKDLVRDKDVSRYIL